ncbi:unnamed protein product, partial [Ectocarpus fasciculatus]
NCDIEEQETAPPPPPPAAAGKQASDKPPSAEIRIETDGAVARLRVYVVPSASTAVARFGESGGGGSAGWRCEVVEFTRDSLG